MIDNIFFSSLSPGVVVMIIFSYFSFCLQTQGVKVKETARKETDKLRRA